MATYKVINLPEAENDLEEIIQWYNSINPSISTDFFNELNKFYQNLQTFPNMFPDDFLFVKKVSLQKFPYIIYFVPDDINFEVIVVAILHQKRDAKVLRERINFE